MKSITIREIIFFCTALILAYFLFMKGCSHEKDFIPKAMYDASQDSLHKTTNKLGQEQTSTKLISGKYDDLLKLSNSKDTTIQKLIKLVNKKTISASVLSNTTSNTINTGTTATPRDTIRKDSLILVYPEYSTLFKNRWENFNIKANKDTIKLDYTVFNEFELKQEFQKQKIKGKLFKQYVAVSEVTNLNPHTTTTELKTFTKQLPKPKRWKAFVSGAVLGTIGGIVLYYQVQK